jgi:hypothetical protein
MMIYYNNKLESPKILTIFVKLITKKLKNENLLSR